MWERNQDGEWYCPLHPERAQDHLRVWLTRGMPGLFEATQMPSELQGWRGALVLDGEYVDITRVGPFGEASTAREALLVTAGRYLTTLTGSLLLAHAEESGGANRG